MRDFHRGTSLPGDAAHAMSRARPGPQPRLLDAPPTPRRDPGRRPWRAAAFYVQPIPLLARPLGPAPALPWIGRRWSTMAGSWPEGRRVPSPGAQLAATIHRASMPHWFVSAQRRRGPEAEARVVVRVAEEDDRLVDPRQASRISAAPTPDRWCSGSTASGPSVIAAVAARNSRCRRSHRPPRPPARAPTRGRRGARRRCRPRPRPERRHLDRADRLAVPVAPRGDHPRARARRLARRDLLVVRQRLEDLLGARGRVDREDDHRLVAGVERRVERALRDEDRVAGPDALTARRRRPSGRPRRRGCRGSRRTPGGCGGRGPSRAAGSRASSRPRCPRCCRRRRAA